MKKYILFFAIAMFCVQGMTVSGQASTFAKALFKGSITSGAHSLLSGRNPVKEAIKQAQPASSRRVNTNLGTGPYVQPQVISTPRAQTLMAPALKPLVTVSTNTNAMVLPTNREFKASNPLQSESRHLYSLLHFLNEKMTPEWTHDSLDYYYEQYMQLEKNVILRNTNSDIQNLILMQKSDMTLREFDKNVSIENE